MIIKHVPDNMKKYVRNNAAQKLMPEEVQLFFKPLKDDNGNLIDWILVGEQICTKVQCEKMYNSCSSCHDNSIKDAEEEIKKAKLYIEAKKSGLIIASPKLILGDQS